MTVDCGRIRVLITGASGQLGGALQLRAPADATVAALDSTGLDVTDAAAVRAVIESTRPDVIINAAAYTAVDRAEAERDRAFRVNADGPAHLASAAAATGARLIHVSTDFVFDGTQRTPYRPGDLCNPVNVYGASKLAGEDAVTREHGASSLIIRTSWLYAAQGRNFVHTMIRLLQAQQPVRVVNDQVGCPTCAVGLADAIWAATRRPDVDDILHWTDAGATTWHEFACAIASEASAIGLTPPGGVIHAIGTAEYPTAARRPAFSVLDSTAASAALGLAPAPWRDNLTRMLKGLCRAA